MITGAAPRAFHVMSKPTGAICNLDCEYCFFLSKEQLYPGSGFRMEPEVHEAYVSQLLAAQRGLDEIVVAFQGGEPTLMGLDFFRRTLELEAQYAAPGQRVLNTVQTNATLIDDDWGEFLRENQFLVGVSIDGPREMHDAFRVDKGGKPTFDRVIRGLESLKRHDVDWNALTTVNAANGDHGREVYRFLRDELGATFVQLIPIVERVTAELLPLADGGLGRAGRPTGRSTARRATSSPTAPSAPSSTGGSSSTSSRSGSATTSVTSSCRCSTPPSPTGWAWTRPGCASTPGPAATRLALEHNGDLYSCDHYVEPGYLLGNIADGRTLLELVDLAPAAGVRARPSSTPCRRTAWTATCGSPATAAAPRTAS